MRRSEFDRAVEDEFGAAYGAVITADLGLFALGGRTAVDAIAAGVDPREVWLALCNATDVPAERRYGVGRFDPRS
ncbi:MAG TPA: DUF3046 domain-containing protein [Microbacterium sp.]|nr:DUF3046 domain-containing protein [Microbacterium sp.]